jgi:hypothetical protein
LLPFSDGLVFSRPAIEGFLIPDSGSPQSPGGQRKKEVAAKGCDTTPRGPYIAS